MHIAFLTFVIVAVASLSSGCFYAPDRDRVGLAYDASVQPADGGMGALCESSDDCAAYDQATYCAFNPMYPNNPGQCTIPDCEAGDCPADYQCCACPETIYAEVICIDDATAEQAALYGCSCS